MAFKLRFPNGKRLRLIEINGVLFAVLKRLSAKKEALISSRQDMSYWFLFLGLFALLFPVYSPWSSLCGMLR
jgi:hypothetical protein